ncbi:hypothetical protein EVG20_g1504 [Dentipellis fragilis]|uniref:DUF6533 domain-containing protein n=1 Tax=Dentipellis fragilis TaxID=205917 RepID=A0A4Y9ZC00_9AGAM|nr:hypothetical protein EVG20_g1504 [Dentipellis fragilis]
MVLGDYFMPHISSAIPVCAGVISCAVLNRFQIRGDHALAILVASIFLSSCLAFAQLHVPLSVSFIWSLTYLVALSASTIFYRISPWHPLASYPGPFTWRLSTVIIAYVSYTGRRHVILDDLHRRYGRIVRIGPNMLSVNSASATAFYDVSHRMTKSDVYNRPGHARGVTLFFKQGMSEHAKRKKLWANAFTSTAYETFLLVPPQVFSHVSHSVSHYFSVLDRKTRELVDCIEQRKDASGALDFVTCVSRWSSDFMGEMLFGDCSTMKFMKNGDPQGIMYTGKKLVALLDSLGHMAWLMDIIHHLPIPTALFDFGGLAVAAFHARELMDDSKAKDLSSHLLNGDLRTGERIPSAELSVDMSIAFQAGADSTASLILFALYFMLSNPSYYQGVRDELDELFPDATSPLEISTLAGAPLLNANLNESIRLSTSFFLPRVVSREGITVAGHYIPAGTVVAMATYSQQIAPENFSPEPLAYRPERWLPGGLGPSSITNKAVVAPFSSGPFVCVAKRFSLQELRFVIARLILTLDMSLPPSFDSEEFLHAVFLHCKIIVHKRVSRWIPLPYPTHLGLCTTVPWVALYTTPGHLRLHPEGTMDPLSSEMQKAFEEAPGITGVKYLSGVAVTILLWDTLLTMNHEIRLVWCRPFTRVKFVYVLLRYPVIGCQLFQGFGWLIVSGFIALLTLGLADREFQFTHLTKKALLTYECFVSVILIMQVYTLWDHRPRVLQALFGAFAITFASLIAFGVASLIKMLGAIVYDSEIFHMCLIKAKPATWVGLWASQVAFDICVFVLTFLNAASRPRIVGAKIITDLLRDGGLFFVALFSLRLLNLLLCSFKSVSFMVLGFFFDWSMVTVLVCRLLLRVEYMKLPSHKRHTETSSTPSPESFPMHIVGQ